MKCSLVIAIGMAAVVLALPVEQHQSQQGSSVVAQFPGLDPVLIEATREVEAIRKARQILDVNVGVINGGMCISYNKY